MHTLAAVFDTSPEQIALPAVQPEILAFHAIIAARATDPLIAAFSTLKTALEVGPVDLGAFRAAFGLS